MFQSEETCTCSKQKAHVGSLSVCVGVLDACMSEFHNPQRDVAEAQMKAVYLVSPEPVIFHSQLMGEIIRHVQFVSTDRELPLLTDMPPKYCLET